MGFKTYIPSPVLLPYVKSFVISENELSETYKILPDVHIVMGFQYSGKLSYQTNDSVIPLSSAGITGLNDTFKLFKNSKNIGTVLVIFSETGAASFFNVGMHELFGESLGLDNLMLKSQMDVVAEEIAHSKTDEQRIAAVEKFLLSKLNRKIHDELVNLAVALIKQAQGNIRITELASKLNISQSQFEKRFRKIVGSTPKKFATIVRLRSIVENGKNDSITGIGLDAGYFDQAHFIKDFKSFTGETPERFFGK